MCSSSGRPSTSAPRAQVVALHRAGERLVLHPLDHRRGLEIEHALRRPHERRRGDEARPSRRRRTASSRAGLARHAGVVGVRQDRARHPLRIALLAQDLDAAERMVRRVGPALVVEVVEQRDDAPVLLVLAPQPRVAAHRGLDRQRVLPQALALRVFRQQRPGGVARQHRPPILSLSRSDYEPSRITASALCASASKARQVSRGSAMVTSPTSRPAPTASARRPAQIVDQHEVIPHARSSSRRCDRRPRRPARPRPSARSPRRSRAPRRLERLADFHVPPGRLHCPASGSYRRLTSTTPVRASGVAHPIARASVATTRITAPTPTMGRAGYSRSVGMTSSAQSSIRSQQHVSAAPAARARRTTCAAPGAGAAAPTALIHR